MMCPMRRCNFILIAACLIWNCLLHYNCAAANAVDNDGKSNNNNNRNNNNAAAAVGSRWRIDITRKHSVQLNGVEIKEHELLDHLEDHERELILGKAKTTRPLKLVHLQQLADATTDSAEALTTATAVEGEAAEQQQLPQHAHSPARRVKRADNGDANSATINTATTSTSTASSTTTTTTATPSHQSGAQQPSQEVVSVQIKDHAQSVNLQLRQTPQLIDDAFVFIRRYANSTQLIEDSHKLASRYERCFYSNENSALDLCDDENVRGVFHHNSIYYIIHPLPARFGNSTHVILETADYSAAKASTDGIALLPLTATALDTNLQFEPAEEDFNESNLTNYTRVSAVEHTSRPTRNTDNSVGGRGGNVPQHYNYYQQHNGGSKSQEQKQHELHLNLRYKPRYHHKTHHQHHPLHVQRQKHQLHAQKSKRDKHDQHQQQQFNEQQQHQHQHHQHQQRHSSPAADPAHSHSRSHFQHPHQRHRRHIASHGLWSAIPQVLHIETAIFVDRDLFMHMAKNFPHNTESQMIRFVLAMINAVQLLYHDPSLGHRINFVLKRLEILYKDPPNLRRSEDIDTYLSNFCMWQKAGNPSSDRDTMHYDHAVILTGLDLYVVDKNGKKISQVVGLAPVAGMCTLTSSCTINEGKHFESVFVVAHEIGHNLGMRHDTSERNCDPSRFIMSPTLGSGKTTWSDCSRNYLEDFLSKSQASCLFDRGQFANNLDHSAEGILPGERFDADQQCMLKYGSNSQRARNQKQSEICTDLHCQRERYTWTSHPALEGTECGANMWCRSGTCVVRPAAVEPYHTPKQTASVAKLGYDKSNFLESSKMGHLLHGDYSKLATWSEWSEASDCDSGCLYGPSKRLREGSTGLRTFSRSCVDNRRRCLGRDRKYESCIAKQCYSVNIITIADFATDICSRAPKSDAEFTGEGVQIIGDIEDSCKIFCRTKSNSTKARRWTFPDGTTCRSKRYKPDDISYCIGGRCEKFSCDNSTQNYYKIGATFCQQRPPQPSQPPPAQSNNIEVENRRVSSYNSLQNHYNEHAASNNVPNYGGYAPPTTYRSKYENEVAVRSFHGQERDAPYKRKADVYQPWHKYSYPQPVLPTAQSSYASHQPQPQSQPQPQQPSAPASASLVAAESEWIVKSGCHSSCMAKSKGVQVVMSRRSGTSNIQLCTHTVKPCERLLTPTEHAEHTCARYKLKVRGLSGYGTQIAASVDEPDRSCRVGCQDEFIKYRFYLVNGRYGHFPLGTKCSHTEERYCVNGKCLEFGADNIPLQQSHISLALFRNRRALEERRGEEEEDEATEEEDDEVLERELQQQRNTATTHTIVHGNRQKRSYLYFDPVNITETITQDFINGIVRSIMEFEHRHIADELLTQEHIEFNNPIHLTTTEMGN